LAGAPFAPANGWLGPQAGNMVSGSTGAVTSYTTYLSPVLKVNPALSLQGSYRIGNVNADVFPGATNAFAFGEWLMWWGTARLPWGLIAFGKRPFQFGCGLQFDAGDRTQEHLAIVPAFGPFRVGIGFYPWRQVRELTDLGEILYWNPSDTNAVSPRDLFAFVNYAQGSLEMGVMGTYYDYHAGPEGFAITPGFSSRDDIAPLDVTGTEGTIFMRYNNGRFFCNAEADWFYRTARWQRSLSGNFLTAFPLPASGANGVIAGPTFEGSSLFRPQYTESWRYMVEFGAMSGPAKVSLLYSFIPGPDRRHGVLIDRQPVQIDLYRPYGPGYTINNPIVWNQDHGNTTVFRPYSLIMVSNYGSGVGALDRGGNGYMVDGNVWAARVDYALAANLNVYSSFLYAKRASHGYGWGYIKPGSVDTGSIDGTVVYRPTGTYAAPSPAIPDNSLGWEVTAGLDWKLAEGYLLSLTAAYWEPGRWFNYACISKAVPGWNAPAAGNLWGINPNRDIDPIFGLLTNLSIYF
jgi:hypothetical protein